MKKIKEYVEKIDEELEGAEDYIEKALEYKAKGDSSMYGKFKTLAEDELRHAMTIHDVAVKDIEELKKVYTPPVEMEEAWEKSHKMYIERAAKIKTMIAM